jgi:hypothetical protein
LRPFGKKLSERHGAIFRALKNPPRVVAIVEDAIGAHTRTQTVSNDAKTRDNIGYKDDT